MRVGLREALKQNALEIGFDLVGIAPATPGRDLSFAREWAERGYGGEMRYLANPKRFDPRAVLPSLKSVICVGLVYDTSFPYSTEAVGKVDSRQQAADGENTSNFGQFSNFDFPVSIPTERAEQEAHAPKGWISRYAWGRDYHEVMREKLERLRVAVEGLAPEVETRVYVDTGPVIERAFARISGLGWMGKNTCIINEEKGSWFFLGVILTNLELEPDPPAPDRCGTCRACLDACPTGALVEPYVMDASRCISYLTIELKGSIPRELRSGIGANIFGCDICQDVCPWNSKGRDQVSGARSQEEGFAPMTVDLMKLETGNPKLGVGPAKPKMRIQQLDNPKSEIQSPPSSSTQSPAPSTFSLFSPPLESLATMREDEFRKIFAHSPIKRAKYRGWLRNLCVAMGNSGDARLVPKLQELSQHPAAIIREHAAWAMERLRTRRPRRLFRGW